MDKLKKNYLLLIAIGLIAFSMLNGELGDTNIPGFYFYFVAIILAVTHFVRKENKSRARKISKVVMIALGIPVALVLIFLASFYADSWNQKKYISAHYQLNLPDSFRLTDRQWTDQGIDVRANWEYMYDSTSDTTDTYNQLIKVLQANGYQIATGSCPSDSYLTAVNKDADIYLTITISPEVLPNETLPKTSTVRVEADKNNHDNVYIDPKALECAQ